MSGPDRAEEQHSGARVTCTHGAGLEHTQRARHGNVVHGVSPPAITLQSVERNARASSLGASAPTRPGCGLDPRTSRSALGKDVMSGRNAGRTTTLGVQLQRSRVKDERLRFTCRPAVADFAPNERLYE
jgi:hypothetical protein